MSSVVIRGKEAPKCTEPDCFICNDMDLSGYLCPWCGAHLAKSNICLNACHLTPAMQQKFRGIMQLWGKTYKESRDAE